MSTSATTVGTSSVNVRAIGVGAAGGALGGIVFGFMMQAWGMIPMVAMLVDSESSVVGWGLHMVVSALFGAVFGLIAGQLFARPVAALLAGVGYGAALWVLGPLLMMPARLGMDLFVINDMTSRSLVGHLIFGAVLGGVGAMAAAIMLRSEPADVR